MNTSFNKRLFFFSRVILIISLLATAVWLQKVDSKELRDHVRDLELLAQLQHVPRPEELARLEGRMFESAAEWLTASDRATSRERASVRHRFTQWLAHQGAMESQLGAMSGKVGAAQGQPIPFYFMRLAGQKLKTPDPLARPVRVSAPVPGELRIDSSASDSVAHFLDKLDRLLSPIQLECAVALDEKSLEGKQLMVSDPGGVLDDGGEPHFAEYPHLVSVELFGSDVVVRYLLLESGEGPVDDGSIDRLPMMQSIHPMHFADAGRGGPYRPGPAFIQNRSVSIPVETRRSAETTLLYLSDPGNPHYELLGELQRSADRIAYLRKTYGHLPISSAIGICSDGLTKAYRNVELFGFSFSTRRLPFVVLAFIICSLVSILSTLVVSARVGQVPLSGSSDDYAVDILLSRGAGRALVWVGAPLLSSFATLPLIALPDVEQWCWRIGAGVVFLLGVASCIAVLRLASCGGEHLGTAKDQNGVGNLAMHHDGAVNVGARPPTKPRRRQLGSVERR